MFQELRDEKERKEKRKESLLPFAVRIYSSVFLSSVLTESMSRDV